MEKSLEKTVENFGEKQTNDELTCLVAVMPNLVHITNFSLPWILMALPTSSSL
jgi:hypothetical protein